MGFKASKTYRTVFSRKVDIYIVKGVDCDANADGSLFVASNKGTATVWGVATRKQVLSRDSTTRVQ